MGQASIPASRIETKAYVETMGWSPCAGPLAACIPILAQNMSMRVVELTAPTPSPKLLDCVFLPLSNCVGGVRDSHNGHTLPTSSSVTTHSVMPLPALLDRMRDTDVEGPHVPPVQFLAYLGASPRNDVPTRVWEVPNDATTSALDEGIRVDHSVPDP